MNAELFPEEEIVLENDAIKRITLMHKGKALQCRKCYAVFEVKYFPDSGGMRPAYCLECRREIETDILSCAERDQKAGVTIYAVDFQGTKRLCERHPLRLEWYLGKESQGTSGSVGSGVPIIITHKKNTVSARYASWLAETLSRRPGKQFRALYRLISIQAQ